MAKLIIEKEYSQVPNSLNNSNEVSLKAKGLYSYLNGKPHDWEFASYRIAKELKESEGCIKSTLQELETHGWLVREKYQNSKGHHKVKYILKSLSTKILSTKNLPKEIPTKENPMIGKVANKERNILTKKENINKESISQKSEIGIYNYKTTFNHFGLGYESNVKIPKKYQDVNLREYISKNRDVEGLSEDHFIKMISKEYYFNVFWEKYPKKVGKKAAKDAFMKLDLTTSSIVSEKVEYYALSRENEDPKFTKHASTYLNQESYNDEIAIKRLVLPEDYMFRDLNAEQKKLLSPEKLKSYENHRARGEAEGYYFKPAKMIYEEVKIN